MATEDAMNRVILLRFREVGLRYVQIARAGQAKEAGYEILDDSTAPRRMHMRGTKWRLSDEMLHAGTVPQVAHGKRLCSARAKGDNLDAWMADEIAGGRLARDFRHVIGFAADLCRRFVTCPLSAQARGPPTSVDRPAVSVASHAVFERRPDA